MIARLDEIIENQRQLLQQIGKQRLDGDDIVEDVLEHPVETMEELEGFSKKLWDPALRKNW